MRSMFIALGALVLIILVGCEKESSQASTAAEPLPPNLIATAEPPGAVDLITARKTAEEGHEIVIKGRVGGQKEPLAKNRAIMTLSDLSLQTCDKSPMEKCETPWDSCCEPPDVIAAKIVSVQVVGPDGRPIKSSLGAIKGIAPLKEVVVSGTVRRTAGNDGLVVEAKTIYVLP